VATSLGPGATSPIRGPPRNCESSLRGETSTAQLTAPLLPRAPRPSRRTGGWRPQRAAEELVFRCPELGFMARNHHLVRQSRDMGLLMNALEPRELGDGGRGWPMPRCPFLVREFSAQTWCRYRSRELHTPRITTLSGWYVRPWLRAPATESRADRRRAMSPRDMGERKGPEAGQRHSVWSQPLAGRGSKA
jgi:hypothetical protein